MPQSNLELVGKRKVGEALQSPRVFGQMRGGYFPVKLTFASSLSHGKQ